MLRKANPAVLSFAIAALTLTCDASASITSDTADSGAVLDSEATDANAEAQKADGAERKPIQSSKKAPLPSSDSSADPALAKIDSFIKELETSGKIDKSDKKWRNSMPVMPMLEFDAKKDYFWHLRTTKGDIKIRLLPDVAPMHASSTLYLIRSGYYDNLIFHRVIPGFMAQGGCPDGTGRGGPAYKYAGETDPAVKHDRPGLLSMANAGAGTDGSQFFLTFVPTPWLDGKHTIFGEVVDGMTVLKALEAKGSRAGRTSERLEMIQSTSTVVSKAKKAAGDAGEKAGGTSAASVRKHVATLVELLRDDSPSVLDGVTRELATLGKSAVAGLRRASRDDDARLRGHARNLLAAFERQRTYRRLLGYVQRRDIDLEQALYLLASLDRPRFDRRPYQRALDAMGREVAKRAAAEAGSFARPLALTQYLSNELGFIGSEVDFEHPDNIHLHRTIERKRGMPLTLTAIYLFVARRAGFRAAPLALPGRVLLRLYLGERSMILDPFDGGRARTRSDCMRYLALHGLVPRPEWFRDASDGALFRRHLGNLMQSYQLRGLTRDARALHTISLAMNPLPATPPTGPASVPEEGAER